MPKETYVSALIYFVILVVSSVIVFLLFRDNYKYSQHPSSVLKSDTLTPSISSDVTSVTVNASLAQANNDFGWRVFYELAIEDDTNVFISPVSLELALLMTYNGASGETATEMAKALGVSKLKLDKINKGSKDLIALLEKEDEGVLITLANSLWGADDIEYKQTFEDVMNEYFSAEVKTVDFTDPATLDLVNTWISDNTNEKIQDMLSDLDPASVLLLINAIYFNGTWETEFDPELTDEETFIKAGGSTTTVDMMKHEKSEFNYYEDDDLQLVELPYTDGNTVMYVALPTSDTTVDALISDLGKDSWKEKVDQMETKEGSVALPKFKVEYGTKEMNESLQVLGMKKAFTSQADFTNIAKGSGDWFISRVLHKAFVEVNEEGTEAAAATVVEMTKAVEEPDIFEFIADQPFVFLICDKESGAIMFMGVLRDPGE